MNQDKLRERGERMSEALSREGYEAGAGLKAETHFERIFEAYADCASDEAWEAARGNRYPSRSGAADNRVGRVVAPLDDRLQAWESAAVITLDDGERMPYQQAGIAIANEPRREPRGRSTARGGRRWASRRRSAPSAWGTSRTCCNGCWAWTWSPPAPDCRASTCRMSRRSAAPFSIRPPTSTARRWPSG